MRKDMHHRLFPSAFSMLALTIFEQIASQNLNSNTNERWDLLQACLCNSSQKCFMRMNFDTMAWDEGKEDVSAFYHLVWAAALVILDAVFAERLLDCFTQSLHGRLRNHALAPHGNWMKLLDAWL